jgi:chorismate mutase
MRRLRRRIDALDRRVVALLNQRAVVARELGRLKAAPTGAMRHAGT